MMSPASPIRAARARSAALLLVLLVSLPLAAQTTPPESTPSESAPSQSTPSESAPSQSTPALTPPSQIPPTEAELPPGNALQESGTEAVTPDAAAALVRAAEAELAGLSAAQARASWIYQNFITSDTEALAAEQDALAARVGTRYAERARAFDGLELDPALRRKLDLLKRGADLPAPHDRAQAEELSRLAASMNGLYGSGRVCPEPASGKAAGEAAATGGKPGSEAATASAGGAAAAHRAPPCRTLEDLEQILAQSRDPAELASAWEGWHATARRYREQFGRFVELADQGSREAGDADLGVHWRSNYDMPADAFAAEMERLWLQLQPLYTSLHTYVRHRLIARYGAAAERSDGLIPAHLLGNMWSQTWDNLFPLLDAPPGNSDLTPVLQARGFDAQGIVRTAEGFFTSLGFEPLPPTFWKRSLFVRPQDRDVVCHASAWDLDNEQDLRIKMCIRIDEENFVVAHHELGHNFYQRAYASQPFLFKGSANDGFHEAIGDTIALSVTPDYLKTLKLIDKVPGPDADIALLLHRALDKVAFLPFAYLVDQWRWRVFAGEVGPEDYDRLWWELRARYQGIARPTPATPGGFDAGAKYHVAANVPYARYFLADVLQFQFHRALCREAGYTGPLHRCSIYGNAAAGDKLREMLALGASKPWPEALKTLTGEEQMDAGAILDYFAPLKAWLDQKNAAAGTPTGSPAPASEPAPAETPGTDPAPALTPASH